MGKKRKKKGIKEEEKNTLVGEKNPERDDVCSGDKAVGGW